MSAVVVFAFGPGVGILQEDVPIIEQHCPGLKERFIWSFVSDSTLPFVEHSADAVAGTIASWVQRALGGATEIPDTQYEDISHFLVLFERKVPRSFLQSRYFPALGGIFFGGTAIQQLSNTVVQFRTHLSETVSMVMLSNGLLFYCPGD